jgi:hypothetical protein
MLQASTCFNCMIESSSRHPARRTSPPIPQSGSVSRDKSGRGGQVRLFLNGCAK